MQSAMASRVPSWMKRTGVILGLFVVLAVVAFTQWRSSGKAPMAPEAAAKTVAPSASTPTNQAGPPSPIREPRKLTSLDERRAIADRIAAAQAARGATRAAPRPQLPDQPENRGTIEAADIQTAVRAMIPHIAECYEAALPQLGDGKLTVVANMTLTGDPDVGTLVDAKELSADTGKPLPASFDDCVRSTLQLIALPPLKEGDKVDVRYPFTFNPN
jgi:hypothetical protein